MTTNGLIAATLIGIVAGALTLGVAFIKQARGRIRQWPVSALVAIAGPYIMLAIVIAQIVIFRLYDVPWPFGVNDIGTLVVRLLAMILIWSLVFRVNSGRLLTESDQRRVREGPDA